MDDTISRQAAIDAAIRESQVDGAYGYMDTKSIIDLLEDLPSAPRWIPVTERFPEENGRYLVSGGIKGSRQIWICEFVMMANVRGWINDASNPIVLAWMPLPEPWKGD